MGRKQLEAALRELGNPERAMHSAGFFKTGKGQYGEGDQFLGIAVGPLRKTALQHRDLGPKDLIALLQSPLHEFRLAALEILVAQYKKADESGKQQIFDFYLTQTSRINNWDLVDASSRYIVGEHLINRPRELLFQLAKSSDLWERRIAMVSTFTWIKRGDVKDALRIAELLLDDKHDLMHKAVGWMLREVGKAKPEALRRFLRKHAPTMPRTALRYAIERFDEEERANWLKARAEKDSARVPAR